MNNRAFILGAGVTGLAAGISSGLPVFEAASTPGGICSSYYVRPGSRERLLSAPPNGAAYRFEIGGGHWIFGGDPLVVRFICSITPVKSYARRSAVYFPDKRLRVPYPIQNHLRYLGPEIAAKALREMVEAANGNHQVITMADWLQVNFGRTLCELFFDPFHESYTAELWKRIAPQDGYKSPVDLSRTIYGAFNEAPPVGYNAIFIYPIDGLNTLAQRMAAQCDIHYEKRAVRIDVKDKCVQFEDGSVTPYETLLSTLPLNRVIELTDLTVNETPDPSPSVLVVNIGAVKGPNCPRDHWLYISKTNAGFHRVGFYSNVDPSFLPMSVREGQRHVSIYVEKAYGEEQQPDSTEINRLCVEVVKELQEWGWIEEVEVEHPTCVDVAYTWAWPSSQWKVLALKRLREANIYQVGRYGRWLFQGIADSIRDGLMAGSAFRQL